MTDKPVSMSVKDWLIKKMSIELFIKEPIINAVVTHQFNSANDAFKNNNSVELSGFGKFVFNVSKANRKLEKYYKVKESYLKKLETHPNNNLIIRKLDSLIEDIKYLETKLERNGKD